MKAFLQKLMGIPLSCEAVNTFIEEYLDDALHPDIRTKFEKHIARCRNCAAYFDQYQATIHLVHDADRLPDPPSELVEMTLAFLDQHLNNQEK